MLKSLPDDLSKTTVHGPIPPRRFWGYYTGPEIAELANIFRGKIVDVTTDSLMVEVTK